MAELPSATGVEVANLSSSAEKLAMPQGHPSCSKQTTLGSNAESSPVSSTKEDEKSDQVKTTQTSFARNPDPDEKSEELFVSDLEDDQSLRTVTVRSCLTGFLVGILSASVTQLFIFKPVYLHVPALFIQLVCFILGTACAAIPGPEWWNPGPFSLKEIGFASIMATAANGDTYTVMMFSAQDLYFNHRYGAAVVISTMMSSQLIGFSLAGLLRPLLVYPANCPYPSMLPSVTLIKSLAGRDRVSKDQLKFFKKALLAISVYEFLPGYLAPALQAISPWCLTLPQSQIVTQLFGGSQINEGLGLFAFSFDWGTLGAYGPLYVPFIAQVHQWVAVLFSIFLFMAAYRFNWFGGGVDRGFPFMSVRLINDHGGLYNITAAVFPNGTENIAAVAQMGIPKRATTAVLSTAFSCLSASAAVSSVLLYKWKGLWTLLKRSNDPDWKEDPHRTIVKNYREFPTYGILIILVLSCVTALLVTHYSQSGLSVAGMLFALMLAGILSISSGFVFASTGLVMSLYPPIQFLGGLVLRGNALTHFWFSTLVSTSTYQCLHILKDWKLGQYLLLSPMSVFLGQLFGSISGTLACYGVMKVLLANERDVLLLPNGNKAITGIHLMAWEAKSISYGLFAYKLYTPGKIYSVVVYALIAGLFAPIPFYLLHRWKPSVGFDKIDVTIFSQSVPLLTESLGSGQMTAVAMGFWSQFYMRRYQKGWFRKYNNILNAALLGGTEITLLVLLFFFQGGFGWTVNMPNYFLNPQGPPDYCEASGPKPHHS